MDSKRHFDASKLLSPNIIIESAGTHLYRIGLSLFQSGSKKRDIFHNLIIIFVNISLVIIRCLVSFFLRESDEDLVIIIGDFSHFIKAKIQYNFCSIVFFLLPLISQIIHYSNYKKGINASYLKPFEMISGLISPKSIGLTNEEEIHEFVKRSKFLFIFCKICSVMSGLIGLLMYIICYLLNCSLTQTIIFGTFHGLHFDFLLFIPTLISICGKSHTSI
jgi:hypothetical protein